MKDVIEAVFGFPDTVLHVLVGAVLFHAVYMIWRNAAGAWFAVLALELVNECNDVLLTFSNRTLSPLFWADTIEDIYTTMLYPTLVVGAVFAGFWFVRGRQDRGSAIPGCTIEAHRSRH